MYFYAVIIQHPFDSVKAFLKKYSSILNIFSNTCNTNVNLFILVKHLRHMINWARAENHNRISRPCFLFYLLCGKRIRRKIRCVRRRGGKLFSADAGKILLPCRINIQKIYSVGSVKRADEAVP